MTVVLFNGDELKYYNDIRVRLLVYYISLSCNKYKYDTNEYNNLIKIYNYLKNTNLTMKNIFNSEHHRLIMYYLNKLELDNNDNLGNLILNDIKETFYILFNKTNI